MKFKLQTMLKYNWRTLLLLLTLITTSQSALAYGYWTDDAWKAYFTKDGSSYETSWTNKNTNINLGEVTTLKLRGYGVRTWGSGITQMKVYYNLCNSSYNNYSQSATTSGDYTWEKNNAWDVDVISACNPTNGQSYSLYITFKINDSSDYELTRTISFTYKSPSPDTFDVAGNGTSSNGWCCGASWSANGCAMTGNSSSYPVYKTFSNVPVSSDLQFKVTKNDSWDNALGWSSYSSSKSTLVNATASDAGGNDHNIKLVTTAPLNITVFYDGTDVYVETELACTNPTVTTNSTASSVGLQTTTVKGTITNGTCTVSEGGICYSTGSTPTISDSKVSKSYTSGTQFSVNLSSLSPGTKYYYCAYATLESGATIYGNIYNFTTTSCSAPSSVTSTQMAAANYCKGAAATALEVTGSGGVTPYSYQWYSNTTASTSGGSSISGANSKTYTPPTSTAEDKYYYCVVKSASPCASYTKKSSVSGLIHVDATSVGGTAAADASTVCSGTGTTIRLTGNTGSIQWQKSTTSSSSGFSNISSATSSELSTGNLTQNTWYRAVVTSGVCSSANSSVAAVSIYSNPTVSGPMASQTVCRKNTPTSISVTASGYSLSYQWQVKTTGDWTNVGSNSNTFNFGAANTAGTYNYRCVVTDGCGNSVNSGTHVLTVNPLPTPGNISGNSSACSGVVGGVNLTLSGHTDTGTTIQWKKKASGDSNWSNIGGATGTTLSTSQTLETNYRAYVTYDTGCYDYTSNYLVTITPNASIGSVTLSVSTICMGQTGTQATANTVVTGGGVGAWSSTNEAVATVNSSGVITTVGAGTTNIRYTITGGCGGEVYKQTPLKVKAIATAAQYTLSNNTKTYNGSSQAATVTPASGAGAATVYYTGTGSTTYAESTTAPTNAGTYAVTVDAANGDDYCAATNLSVGTLTINKADQSPLTISNTLLDFAYCTRSHTTLTTSGGSGDGAVTYTITSGSGTVDGSTLTATANGSISVTATKAESANYNATTSVAKTFKFTHATPTPYAISAASTAICSGGGGTITLAGSQTGYNYLLYNGITPLDDEGEIKPGTGSAITFDVSSSGVYTAKGYYGTNRENCLTDMEETVVMTISTTPKLVRSATTVTNYTPVTITSVNTDIETWSITNESDTAYSYDKTANSITFKGLSNKSPYTVTATTHGGCSNTTTITVNADTEVCP